MTVLTIDESKKKLTDLTSMYNACNFFCAFSIYGTRSILQSLADHPPAGFRSTVTNLEQAMNRQRIADNAVLMFSVLARYDDGRGWIKIPLGQPEIEILDTPSHKVLDPQLIAKFFGDRKSRQVNPPFLHEAFFDLLVERSDACRTDRQTRPVINDLKDVTDYRSAISNMEYAQARAMHDAIRQQSIFYVAIVEHLLAHDGYGLDRNGAIAQIKASVRNIIKNVTALSDMVPPEKNAEMGANLPRYDWAYIRECGQGHLYDPTPTDISSEKLHHARTA